MLKYIRKYNESDSWRGRDISPSDRFKELTSIGPTTSRRPVNIPSEPWVDGDGQTSLKNFEHLLSKEPTNSQLEDMYVWLVFKCLDEHFPNNSNFTHIKNMLKGSALEWWKTPCHSIGTPLDRCKTPIKYRAI